MIHSPPTNRRVPPPVLQELVARLDCALTTLKESLDADPLDVNPIDADHINVIETLVSQVKNGWKTYREASVHLTDRYVEIASYQEAQQSMRDRAEMRTEVHQFIKVCNGVLQSLNMDIMSNIDTKSAASSADPSEYRNEFLSLQISSKTLPEKVSAPKDVLAQKEGKVASQSDLDEAGETLPKFTTVSGFEVPADTRGARPKTGTFTEPLHRYMVSASSREPSAATYGIRSIGRNETFTGGNKAQNFPLHDLPTSFPQTYGTHPKNVTFTEPLRPYTFSASVQEPPATVSGIGSCGANTTFTGMNQGRSFPSYGQHNSFSNPIRSQTTMPPMSDATLHLVKQELFKESNSPFDGDCYKYNSWVMLLENRMKNLHLDPLDQISILMANTSGRPRKLVEDYLAAGSAFPSATLRRIWDALQKQYGSSVRVSHSMQRKLASFPTIRPPNVCNKLQELAHLCRLIEANMQTNQELQIFDLSLGQKQVWSKLPEWMQKKWRSLGHQYGKANFGAPPPFATLIQFVEATFDEISDPNYEQQVEIRAEKRTYATNTVEDEPPNCLYHDKPGHSLLDCYSFKRLPYADKQKFAADKNLCYKCLGEHFARNCNGKAKCSKCKRDHSTIMHPEQKQFDGEKEYKRKQKREEAHLKDANEKGEEAETRKALCSVVCGSPQRAMSCSKTILCEIHHQSRPNKTLRVYVILDDMSDSSYISEKVVGELKLTGREERYLLSTMNSLRSEHRGLALSGLWIRGINRDKYHSLPKMLSSSFIPGSVYEVGTPTIVRSIPHLSHFADRFVDLDRHAEPLILLGRDAGDLMKSVCHGDHSPFACETPLGYALIGSPCTNIENKNLVKTSLRTVHEHYVAKKTLFPDKIELDSIFSEFHDDDMLGPSREDLKFQSIVENSIHVNEGGFITMRLPFKKDIMKLPDNKAAVYGRTYNTLAKLKSQPGKLQQCVDAMAKNIAAGHVEPVPKEEVSNVKPGKSWFVPIFAVTQPKKDKTRLVFDSSAVYNGISLNSCLLQGEDQNNRLRGVLMRFRLGEIAFGGDIEAMFYNFHLPREDRDFQRYFWFEENKPDQKLIQYRGCVHLFGNKCSPALAQAGLKYATLHPEAQRKPEAVKCITDNVYVDDLLAASRLEEDATKALDGIIDILKRYKIRLCKIFSNSLVVRNHFPASELSSTDHDIEIGDSTVHRALGLAWQVAHDRFMIKVELPEKPFTRRGMLAITSSIYDPIGMVGPVVLRGKLLQRNALRREASSEVYDWDDPLPTEFADEWHAWLQSLSSIGEVSLARSYIPVGFGSLSRSELHVFTDASEAAIGSVVYIRIFDNHNNVHVSYVISSTRLVPKSCISMPRSELCAALLGSNLLHEVKSELRIHIDNYFLYCDSKVVLAYLSNEDKRFARYVSHRVQSILKLTNISQWQYITTLLNPADIACRPQSVRSLLDSVWLKGPDFLWDGCMSTTNAHPCPDLPHDLPEVLGEKVAMKVEKECSFLFSSISERVSTFPRVVGIVMAVMKFCSILCERRGMPITLESSKERATNQLLHSVQRSCYGDLITSLATDRSLKDQKLKSLDPFLDEDCLLRVGGRLKDSFLNYQTKHPILLPAKHSLTVLIIRHYHSATHHQGRHLTLGAIRSAGFFIEKGSKLIKQQIRDCIVCKKLRNRPVEQMMASLPSSRVGETAPFHNAGLDVFGPFIISENKTTRQTKGTKKMWGLMLTCMASRAVHVEPLNGLDTSSLANALRRFIAIRGTCKNLYSDRGTNFIGVKNQEEACFDTIQSELNSRECTWHLNPPHASHFGGAWERKIGAIRRILEGSMAQLRGRLLSRDELSTLLLEATAIVNNTPMWEISSDSKDPYPVSPSMLLTLKDSSSAPPGDSLSESDLSAYGAKRWRRVQYLANCFWERWRLHYLMGLQERSKWSQKRRNVKEGDLVLLRNKNEKRHSWPMAIIRSVKLSSDNLVRSVTLEAAGGGGGSRRLLERPVSELVLLIANDRK